MEVLKVIFAFAQDPEVNCVHYGDNSEYESYGDCYDAKAKEAFAVVGCVPPWFTDIETEICRNDTKDIHEVLNKSLREALCSDIVIGKCRPQVHLTFILYIIIIFYCLIFYYLL